MIANLLPSVDLRSYASQTTGLNAKSLSYIGSIFASVDPSTVDDAFAHLQQTFGTYDTHFDVTTLPSLEDVVSLLDAGAAKLFVNRAQLDQLSQTPNVDLDRIVLSISGSTKEEIISAIGGSSVGIWASNIQDADLVEAWLNEYGTDRPPVFVSFATPSAENAQRVAKLQAIPILPATSLTFEPRASNSLIDATSLLLANAVSDRPDGLFTTLVTDERGIALGLVYSNAESVRESFRTGRGVYHSRKRGLWYKGESSGDIQELVRVNLDCDSDCLRYTVRQKGRGMAVDLSAHCVKLT